MKELSIGYRKDFPLMVQYSKKQQGKLGEVIAIYQEEKEMNLERSRFCFALLLDIIKKGNMYLHFLKRLPELSHKEKKRRAESQDRERRNRKEAKEL